MISSRYKPARYVVNADDGGISLSKSLNITYLEDQEKILENQCDIIKKLLKDLDRDKKTCGGLSKDAETRELYAMMSHLAPSTAHASGSTLLPSQVRLQQLRKERRELIIQRFRSYRALKQFFRQWRRKLLRRCLVVVHQHRIVMWRLQRFGKQFFKNVSRMLGMHLMQDAMDAHFWRRLLLRCIFQWRHCKHFSRRKRGSHMNSGHLLACKLWNRWTDAAAIYIHCSRKQKRAVAHALNHFTSKKLASALLRWRSKTRLGKSLRRLPSSHINESSSSCTASSVVLQRSVSRWRRVCLHRHRGRSATLIGVWNQMVRRLRHWRLHAAQFGSGRMINRAVKYHRRDRLSLFLNQWMQRVHNLTVMQRYTRETQFRLYRHSLLIRGLRQWYTHSTESHENYKYCKRRVCNYQRQKYGHILFSRLRSLILHRRLHCNKRGSTAHPIIIHHNHQLIRHGLIEWIRYCTYKISEMEKCRKASKHHSQHVLRAACKVWKCYHAETDQVATLHKYAAKTADRRRKRHYLVCWRQFVEHRLENARTASYAFRYVASTTAMRRWQAYLRAVDDQRIINRHVVAHDERTLLRRYMRQLGSRCEEISYDRNVLNFAKKHQRHRCLRLAMQVLRSIKYIPSTGAVFACNRSAHLQRSALRVWRLRCSSSSSKRVTNKPVFTVIDTHVELFKSRYGNVMSHNKTRRMLKLGVNHFRLVSKLLALSQWRQWINRRMTTMKLLKAHRNTSLRRKYLLHLYHHAKLSKQCRVHMTTILEHFMHRWKYRHRVLQRNKSFNKKGDKRAAQTFWRLFGANCKQIRLRRQRLKTATQMSVKQFVRYKCYDAFARLKKITVWRRSNKRRISTLLHRIHLRIKRQVFNTFSNERSICSPNWNVALKHCDRSRVKRAMQSLHNMHTRKQISLHRNVQGTSLLDRKRCVSSVQQWKEYKERCDKYKYCRNRAVEYHHRALLRRSMVSWITYIQSTPSKAERRSERAKLCSVALQRMRELVSGHRQRARLSRKQLRIEQLTHVMTVWHLRLTAHQMRLRHAHRAELLHFRIIKQLCIDQWSRRVEVRLRDTRSYCWHLRKRLRGTLHMWKALCGSSTGISYCSANKFYSRRHHRRYSLRKAWLKFSEHTLTYRHDAMLHAGIHCRQNMMKACMIQWRAHIDHLYASAEHMHDIVRKAQQYKLRVGLRALQQTMQLARAFRGTQKIWLKQKFFQWTEKRRHVKLGQGFVKVGLQRMYTRYLELTAECFKIWKEETRIDYLIESHLHRRQKAKLHAYMLLWMRDLRLHYQYRRALLMYISAWRRKRMASELLTAFVLHHQKRGYARYHLHTCHRNYVKRKWSKFLSRVKTQTASKQRSAAAYHHYCYVMYLTVLTRLHNRMCVKDALWQRQRSYEIRMQRYRCTDALQQWRYFYLLRRSNRRMSRIAAKNHITAQKRHALHCITAMQCRTWASGHNMRLQEQFSEKSKRIRGLRSFVKHFRRTVMSREETVLQ